LNASWIFYSEWVNQLRIDGFLGRHDKILQINFISYKTTLLFCQPFKVISISKAASINSAHFLSFDILFFFFYIGFYNKQTL
jgi:hypothetical protein